MLPHRFLTCQHDRQPIEIGDHPSIHGFIKRKQASLVGQELANGDLLFALLRELRPITTDRLLVVEPSPRVGDGQGHGGQALGGGVDYYHRVLLPGLARLLVAYATPEVDNLITTHKGPP